jgi:hypothetical protein
MNVFCRKGSIMENLYRRMFLRRRRVFSSNKRRVEHVQGMCQ